MASARPRACHGVLLVDDDADIRDAVQRILEDEGYFVKTAANGADALQCLRYELSAPPCLILLDIMMPVMDGWQFRSEQIKDPKLASIPVVILTADGKATQKAAAMNAAEGLTKPIRLKQLVSTVQPFMR